MAKQKTNEKFLEEIKNKNELVIPLEEYKGDRTPIQCECGLCQEKFYITPNYALRGEIHKPCGRRKTNLVRLALGRKNFYNSFKNTQINQIEDILQKEVIL